tara:strand:- start:1336 stop:3054 length:1719 start_codon:yes stop_codon:yes gene_type:complete
MIKNIQTIIGGYSNPYFIILIFIVLAALDVLGIGMVPLLIESAVATNSESTSQNWLEGLIPIVPGYSQIEILSFIVVFLFFIKSVVYIYSNYLINKFSYGVMHQNRTELVSLLINAQYQTIINKSAADFINLLQLHINQSVSNYLIPSLKLVSDILVCLLILAYLLIFYPYVSLFLLSISLLLSSAYLMLTRNRIYDYGKRSYENNHAMIDLSKSIRTGFVDITINGGVKYFKDLFVEKSLIFSDVATKSTTLRLIPRPLFEVVIILFMVVIVLFNSGPENAIVQLSLFATFGIAAVRLLPAITSIIASLSLMKNTEAAVEKYFVEKKNLLKKQSDSSITGQIPANDMRGEYAPVTVSNLSIKNVYFQYEEGNDLLNSLSFTLNKGDTIGIVGSSGSGKSTLVSIILGFLKPTNGQVLLDGVNIDEVAVPDYFSYVPQFPFISNDTLLNNIVYPGGDKNIQHIKELMDSLGLSDLHNGQVSELNDIVGESGINLSGGQAQRVALIRAIIQDKNIIVIDEGTSALDQYSSKKVIQILNRIKEEKIIIVVSHRKDILEVCNKVYSLDNKSFNEV